MYLCILFEFRIREKKIVLVRYRHGPMAQIRHDNEIDTLKSIRRAHATQIV